MVDELIGQEKKSVTLCIVGIAFSLTDAADIIEVLPRFRVGLQLLSVKADIHPLIFHYLLMRERGGGLK